MACRGGRTPSRADSSPSSMSRPISSRLTKPGGATRPIVSVGTDTVLKDSAQLAGGELLERVEPTTTGDALVGTLRAVVDLGLENHAVHVGVVHVPDSAALR